jgi:hypothetical protein
MRIHRIGLVAGLLLAAQLAGTSCIFIPKIEKRNVRLAVSQVLTVPLHATGATNTIAASTSVNLRDSVDFAQIVDDAGIDVSKVDTIVVSKVEYRVAVKDATAGRAISNATVNVSVAGGASTPLVTSFSGAADAVTPWTRANLNSSGTAQLNAMLGAVLRELKGGPSANEHVTCDLGGQSLPISVATDFWYEIRLTILVSGTVETDVPN